MPFTSGTLSARRYAVAGDLPGEFAHAATNALRRYSFRPINDEKGERESFGWVNPRALLDTRFSFEDVQYSSALVLMATRRDRKSFSKVLFRARLEEKMRGVRKEKKLDKITRQHRLALEEELAIEMLRETSPVSGFCEVVWDMSRAELYIGATSNALCERIKDLFEATFDLKLTPRHPALLGAEHIAAQGLEREFAATLAAEDRHHNRASAGGADDVKE